MASLGKFNKIVPLFDEVFTDLSSRIGGGEEPDSAKMMRVLTILKNEFSDEELSLIPPEEWKFIAHALFASIGKEYLGQKFEKTESFFRNSILNEIQEAGTIDPLLN